MNKHERVLKSDNIPYILIIPIIGMKVTYWYSEIFPLPTAALEGSC